MKLYLSRSHDNLQAIQRLVVLESLKLWCVRRYVRAREVSAYFVPAARPSLAVLEETDGTEMARRRS